MSDTERPATPPSLDSLYDPPSERIQKAVLPELISFHEQYLSHATFFCLATGSKNGLDASPRGGPPGFVRVLNSKTVTFADWPGNNRIESLRNLEQDDRLGMLFLFPGLNVFMRINGRGRLKASKDACNALAENGKTPKTAIIVSVEEVYFHCGKAINRAHLWDASSQLDRKNLPSPGQMLAAMTNQDAAAAAAIDDQYNRSIQENLYG